MEKGILLVAIIVIGLDALTNAFLMVYAPTWETVKKKEIDELREQNEELRAFVRQLLTEVDED